MHHELIMIDCANIPYEILYCIASSLSYYDSLECSKVCEQWYQPFMDSLWRTVHIDSEGSNEVFDKSQDSNYLINGHLVQEIITYEGIQIDSSQLLYLQKLFPNVQRLSLILTEDQDTAVDWSAWRKLIFFKIVFNGDHRDAITKIFSETFSQLPCLKEVTSCFEGWMTLSIGDLEAIHNVQYLHTLYLSLVEDGLNLQDLADIAKAVPANHLSKVELFLYISDLRLIYYFTIKYQNVRELTLHNISNKTDLVDCHLEEAKSRIAMLPQVFLKLEKLYIRQYYSNDTFTLAFWECFPDGSFSIKEIIYIFTAVLGEFNRIQDTTRELIRVCSKTIESITAIFETLAYIPKTEYLTRGFSYCPRLVYLTFYRCGATMELDTTLDCFPSLKELSLFTGKLYISSKATKVEGPHGLRVINLGDVSTDPDSLKYITTRCESLSHMRLERVNIFGDISPSTGCCLIDMSNARLTELKINSLLFQPSCQEWECLPRTSIHFMKIVRLDKSHPCNTEGSKINKTSMDISNDTISTWHNVFDRGIFPNTLDTVITEQNKVNAIEKYFQDFKVNLVRDRIQDTTIYERKQRPENWTMKLWQGYALFVCGYTKNYNINYKNGSKYEEKYKWDNDKNIVHTVTDILVEPIFYF
ncbi:hypothetical protein CLU79DRAFT_453980 [Phycomyces nitens]|nr:hypothetical protein CLU79DRAFT_453980 [Phycomyces nitens]